MSSVFVLGSFAVDTSYRTPRLPGPGETLVGSSFLLGPGGKGSNQAVAAARAGAHVALMTAIGRDAFGELGRSTWNNEGIDSSYVLEKTVPTGAAAILVDESSGENCIVVVPGACGTLSPEDVASSAEAISSSKVFLAQLEIPVAAVVAGLSIARSAGIPTLLNPAPAPADKLPRAVLELVDYLLPNETEIAQMTGLRADTHDEAARAAQSLLDAGVRHVLVTLGARGALLCQAGKNPVAIPATEAGTVVDTTGAGDAFCGAFAAALAKGRDALGAAEFASAAAGLSVTRQGAASSMARRVEIEAVRAAKPPSAHDPVDSRRLR